MLVSLWKRQKRSPLNKKNLFETEFRGEICSFMTDFLEKERDGRFEVPKLYSFQINQSNFTNKQTKHKYQK
jgi:hypothetical protein